MNLRSGEDGRSPAANRQRVERAVAQMITLSRSDEACRLLGVDGVLVDQVDVTILDDPLDYLSYDVAAAVHDADEDTTPMLTTMLSTLIAEVRFCGLLVGHIDQHDLVERVMRQLRELEE